MAPTTTTTRAPLPAVSVVVAGDTSFTHGLDQRDPLGDIAPVLTEGDVTIVNVETVIAEEDVGAPIEKVYVFKSPPASGGILADAGVDVAALANNHALDYGRDGVLRTIEILEDAGLATAGTGPGPGAAYAGTRPRVDGWPVAVLSFTRVPCDRPEPGETFIPEIAWACPADVDATVAAVAGAAARSDLVVVMAHWGVERQACPEPHQRELARSLGRCRRRPRCGQPPPRAPGCGADRRRLGALLDGQLRLPVGAGGVLVLGGVPLRGRRGGHEPRTPSRCASSTAVPWSPRTRRLGSWRISPSGPSASPSTTRAGRWRPTGPARADSGRPPHDRRRRVKVERPCPTCPPERNARFDVLLEGSLRPGVRSTCTLVRDGDLVAVVDPGLAPSQASILDPLRALGLEPGDVNAVVLSHHHPDHTVNTALFADAAVHDHWAVYRGDQWETRECEGCCLSASVQLLRTPGHAAEELSTVIATPDGVAVATHLWWTAEGTGGRSLRPRPGGVAGVTGAGAGDRRRRHPRARASVPPGLRHPALRTLPANLRFLGTAAVPDSLEFWRIIA